MATVEVHSPVSGTHTSARQSVVSSCGQVTTEPGLKRQIGALSDLSQYHVPLQRLPSSCPVQSASLLHAQTDTPALQLLF